MGTVNIVLATAINSSAVKVALLMTCLSSNTLAAQVVQLALLEPLGVDDGTGQKSARHEVQAVIQGGVAQDALAQRRAQDLQLLHQQDQDGQPGRP